MAGQGMNLVTDPRLQVSDQEAMQKYYWDFNGSRSLGGTGGGGIGPSSAQPLTDSRGLSDSRGLYDSQPLRGYGPMVMDSGGDGGPLQGQGYLLPSTPGLQGPFLASDSSYPRGTGSGSLRVPGCGMVTPPDMTNIHGNGLGFVGGLALCGNNPTTIIHHQPSMEDKAPPSNHDVIRWMNETAAAAAAAMDHQNSLSPPDNPGKIISIYIPLPIPHA